MNCAAKLVVVRGPQKGLSFEIREANVQIGRESSNDFEVCDLSVSRRHCLIRQETLGFVLSSLESTNGTRVNGVPIAERLLEDGDDITIGDTTFRFLLLDAEVEPSPVP